MSLGQYAEAILKRDLSTNRAYAVTNPTVLVRNAADTADVAVFADSASTPLANPLPIGVPEDTAGVDLEGNAMFWTEEGEITLVISAPGLAPRRFSVNIEADNADAGIVSFTRIAATALSAIRAVVPTPAGTVEYADASSLAHRDLPMWVTVTAAAAGAAVSVVAYGPVDSPGAGWTPGSPLFLTTAGVLSHVAPTAPTYAFVTEIGTAESPTRLFVEPQQEFALVP